ncbi:hypothetical protein M0812_17105 [Anaeramoeba flamelloides]|uniref:Uncharacterized protein n=1 Tax=Anaeramoeba flamelloides TaxID=1746091 RepID=A0AAV7ZC48_9EUKA|nr:hypothetical protein M0812_17105 [Anaeramoeba flamelloides]
MDLNLYPLGSIGPLKLGQPIRKVINILQNNHQNYGKVDVITSPNKPLSDPIILQLNEVGLTLTFDQYNQVLSLIEFYPSQNSAQMKYKSESLIDSSTSKYSYKQIRLSISEVSSYKFSEFNSNTDQEQKEDKILKHKKKEQENNQKEEEEENQEEEEKNLEEKKEKEEEESEFYEGKMFYLHFRGLTFIFAIPLKYQTTINNEKDITNEISHQLEPNKILIYNCDQFGTPKPIALPKTTSYMPKVCYNLESKEGILSIPKKKINISLGCFTQQVLSLFGSPDKTFKKNVSLQYENNLNTNSFSITEPLYDYFYNYFEFGIDFLFHNSAHTLKKIILHSNYQFASDFSYYNRCNFQISINSKCTITPFTKFDQILHHFKEKPHILTIKGRTNKFENAVKFYEFRKSGIAFEVYSSYIEKIILFKPH